MMRAHWRLNQVGTAIFSHKHTPSASHPAIQQVPLSSTTQQESLHTQIMSHSLAKSKGTAMTDLVPPKLSWVYILSSMFSDVAPTQPPTMATSLQPINGTAYVMGAVQINSETSKRSSMLNAHVRALQQLRVRELYPAEMLPLHDDHSCPEPTYMKLYPTIIGNWEDNWRYVRYTTTPNIQMK